MTAEGTVAAVVAAIVLALVAAYAAVAYAESQREQSFRACIAAGHHPEECK